jgi:2-dehydropantoate 2-reductase
MTSQIRNLSIIGSGALGSYYGARLQRAGETVSFLMRSDLDHVRKNGLRVRTPDGEFHLPKVRACATPEEIGPSDLVVVGLKTTANEAYERLVGPLLHERTLILTLQNGLGNEEGLAELFGSERVLGGLCFVCLNRVSPGLVENFFPGSVTIGEFDGPAQERTRAIAGRFVGAGVTCSVTDTLMAMRWRKLVWNVPFNGLSVAAGGIATDVILADPGLRRQVRALMEEVATASTALGYPIPESFIEHQIDVTYPMGPYKPSSLVDFLEGREVEVESIWGEPMRRAQEAGVSVPRLEMLYHVLRAIGSGQTAERQAC